MAWVQCGEFTKRGALTLSGGYSTGYSISIHAILYVDRSVTPIARRIYIDRAIFYGSAYALGRISSNDPYASVSMNTSAVYTNFIDEKPSIPQTVQTIDGESCFYSDPLGYFDLPAATSDPKSNVFTFRYYASASYRDYNNASKFAYGSVSIQFPFPQYRNISITAPTPVTLNALNTFSCEAVDFSIFNQTSNLTLTAYAAFGQNYERTSDIYISSSAVLAKNSAFSTLYWYPSYLTAATGDFVNGESNYKIFIELTASSSGLTDKVVASAEITGTILYNETPPAAAAPVVRVSVAETEGIGLFAEYGRYLTGKSKIRLRATISSTFGYGAAIVSRTITLNGSTSLADTSLYPQVDGTYYAYAIDNHGASASASLSYQVYDYWDPELSTFAIHRCLQDGTNDDAGPYVKIEWGIHVAPLGNQNSKALTITHPQGTTTPTLSTYDASGTLIVAADIEHSYDIVLALTDDLGSITQTLRLSTAGAIMDILNGGNGIAFGKVAELADTLEVTPNWDVILNTTGGDKINLVDALEALATAAGIDIHVQPTTQQGS